MRRGSVFLCDVSHSGAAQSGGRASWDTKIGFVLPSPWSALTHSALLPLVSGVMTVNKHLCSAYFVCAASYMCALCKKTNMLKQSSFSSLTVTLHIPVQSHLRHPVKTSTTECPWNAGKKPTKSLHIIHPSAASIHFIYRKLHTNLLDSVTPPSLFCNLVHIFHVCNVFPTSCCAGGEIWPPVSVAGSVVCCDCLPEICINKLPVPACPRCCPGARTFAYRAVIGLPWVPSATAERVGGRQHHKWVLNWNLTAALHFMCVEARSKAESDQGEKRKR